MRVIFVTSSLPYGRVERHAIAIMRRLAQRGHDCHAVCVKEGGGRLEGIQAAGDGGTVKCLRAAAYYDRRAIAEFAADISRIGPSVIVAANPYALMYSSLALRRSGRRAPLIVTLLSTRLYTMKDRLKMLVDRLFFWTADCAVFVCEKQRRYWLYRGVFARRNEVIHNGVDTEECSEACSPEERVRLRREVGFSDADFVIGIAALLRPENNHAQLVDAVAMLRGRGVAARALMVGDGEMRGAIEARARELNVARNVVITGLKAEVRPYVAACDAVASCSLVENSSLALMEAMALRKPVVYPDVGPASEMIFPGWNGFLFPPGDTRALVDKLAIVADRSVSNRLGANARGTVETLFTAVRMVDRYEQVLREICGARTEEAAVT